MKRLFLPLVCFALMAAPSFAQDPTGYNEDPAETSREGGDFESTRRHRGGRGGDKPVAPVPEPGTMALASMGLIALGAAARQRRGK
jgi:hypothetical protein